MKILYGIQGTGNGHLSRAQVFVPVLSKFGSVDVLVSGHSAEVSLDHPIKYRCHGLGYTFGQNGGINYFHSASNFHPVHLIRDIRLLPVKEYDIVISDFEPVTSWAAKLAKIPCAGLSHQASFFSEKTPRPKRKSLFAEMIFRYFAPCTHPFGFHFQPYDDFIYPPQIRQDIRRLTPFNEGHITVYLPAYHHSIIMKALSGIRRPVQIFSKHCFEAFSVGEVEVFPVSSDAYLKSLEACEILICGGGFEAPSEALWLGKKLIVIPMKDQYEQKCNAAALEKMGVVTAHSVYDNLLRKVRVLLLQKQPYRTDYPEIKMDVVEDLIDKMLNSRPVETNP